MNALNIIGVVYKEVEKTMKKKLISSLFTVMLLAGCAGINDSLTPSLSVTKDSFDGSTLLTQSPVSAASSLSEGWNTLGFDWNEKYPDVVFLEVGVNGITNVMGVAFNVDGEVIENIKAASTLTKYGDWSTRRLIMPISDFIKVAEGKDVKMKVYQIDTYTVSSFGPANDGAVVNTKFPPFISMLKQQGVSIEN
ncbi:hypothetical protein [Photobacterium indicum]|uniref:Uncharacterized protein n=1 Tax=Photobacterium indicum TaxID=81447 RepID=A0A2T3LEJ3_9GAMM|nr:hypothetical protein [Photobacterium indicum]PSV49803.1 hypothetical protein C9J47_04395 [Photobacterium indicum]